MMERRIIKLIFTIPLWTLIIGFTVSGCYYDNEECLYPEGGGPCDTANVTFSGVVWPVINDNCVSCHSGGAPSGNVSLSNYDEVAAAGKIAEGQYGSLYGTISHHPDNSPMPKGGDKLQDCTISQIKKWIDQGTPNN